MDLRELPPIAFSNFIKVQKSVVRCDALPSKLALKKPHLVPNFSEHLSEDPLMDFGLGYNEAAFFITIKVHHPFTAAYFPEVEKGDGVELFISTRGKTTGRLINKFCHHFVILPKEVDGFRAAEVTKFRPDDSRDLAPEDSICVDATFEKKSYTLEITLLDKGLYQFDPIEYPHMQFALKMHRHKHPPAHFPQSSMDYKVNKYPELWASLTLI